MIAALFPPIFLLWLVVITVMDLRIRKVRNWMVLLGLATGTAALFSGAQPFRVEPWDGLLGMVVAFAALMLFYAMRWMGAGDVKFAAVMGLWFGLSPELLVIWLGGSLLAGLHGVLVLLWRGLQRSPYGAWLQAHLPTRLAGAFTAPAMAPTSAAQGSQGHSPEGTHGSENALQAKRQIQRSIPYAGYMAMAAIWVVLRTGPQLAG